MHTDSEMSGGEASQHEGMAADAALRALHRTHREATLHFVRPGAGKGLRLCPGSWALGHYTFDGSDVPHGDSTYIMTREHATVFKKVPKRSESYSSALFCFAVVFEKSDLKHSMTTGNGEEAVDLVRLRCSVCRSTRMCQHETVARFCNQIYSQGPALLNWRRRSPAANRQTSACTSWFVMG